ncbi:hypothetical protein N7454_000285 [Penicillium verhagenii]|nr:hypothetical protein N7454_000285 [Penicillium verhagenii]
MESFVNAQAQGSVSIFLERAICLVAAKDPEAPSGLRLVEEGPTVPTRQFCSSIHNGLTVAMDMELESDRLTRIRILALMSLHFEGNDGGEAASLHLCKAIHQAQTIGLHLDRPDRKSEDPLVKLFWGLWTLDKMHASIGGRPVLLADRDIGIPRSKTHPQGAFGVWLAISDLLATVISYYRPSAVITSGWEEGFPAFEDIVGDAHSDLDFSTLGILELYYHCVAILSCRYKSTDGLDGARVSSIRQGLAAVRIQSIVATECTGRLPPLPIVPYAIALSMSVSYRQLRSSKLITHFNRAKASLEACCCLLEDISPRWSSAEAMARLGQKALQHISLEKLQYARPKATSMPQSPHLNSPYPKPVDPSHYNESGSSLGEPGGVLSVSDMGRAPVVSMGSSLSPMDEINASMDGFSDIDALFGEFLDLSLPTNFWDPIFAEAESDNQGS